MPIVKIISIRRLDTNFCLVAVVMITVFNACLTSSAKTLPATGWHRNLEQKSPTQNFTRKPAASSEKTNNELNTASSHEEAKQVEPEVDKRSGGNRGQKATADQSRNFDWPLSPVLPASQPMFSSTDASQLLSLLLDVSRNLAQLQDDVNEIRSQNQLTYRQLKRLVLKCSATGTSQLSSGVGSGGMVYQLPRTSSTDRGRTQHPLKSAMLYPERPQSDQNLLVVPPELDDKQQQQQQLEKVELQQPATLDANLVVPAKTLGAMDSTSRQQLKQSNSVQQQQQQCPTDFTYSAELDSCYRLIGDRTTWRLARQRCRDVKADLAIVDSAREQRYINEQARLNPDTRHCDFWIGLVRGRGSSQDGSSSWHWIGDIGNGQSPSYTNWNTNEPNNANSFEHCTQMLWVFTWRWNDAHCNYGNACYVCQAKPRPYGHSKLLPNE